MRDQPAYKLQVPYPSVGGALQLTDRTYLIMRDQCAYKLQVPYPILV